MTMRIPTGASPTRTYVILGFMSAVLSILLLSEIFGSAAIILGAYVWKQEPERLTGLNILVFGIVAMLIGIYFTAYPRVIDFFFTY
jgi:hypothetical protein